MSNFFELTQDVKDCIFLKNIVTNKEKIRIKIISHKIIKRIHIHYLSN